jgi:hypothetical protein
VLATRLSFSSAILAFTRRREANAVNDEQVELEHRARCWLARTLSWEARLQTLRIRADLALAGEDVPELEPQRDHLVAVMAYSGPDVHEWNERLDRTA